MYGFIYFRFLCLLLHGRQSNCALGTACKVPFRRWQSAVSTLTKCRFVVRESTVRPPPVCSFFFTFHFSLFTFHFSLFTFHFKIILPSYHRSLKPRCTKGWGMGGCPSPSYHHPPIFAPHPPTILRCMVSVSALTPCRLFWKCLPLHIHFLSDYAIWVTVY